MDDSYTRRRLLALSGSTLAGAGCLGVDAPTADETDSAPSGIEKQFGGHEIATPIEDGTLAQQGWPSTICDQPETDIEISAIDDPDPVPAEEWPGMDIGDDLELVETGEPDEDVVIGVERDGQARAYPLATLWWSEIINDDLAGPLLITYCPLCRSGVVADRHIDGATTRFDVSGLLWRPPDRLYPNVNADGESVLGGGPADDTPDVFRDNRRNLVMVDETTDSYWSQLLGTALCGPLAGTELDLVAASMTTFGEWRDRYPETTVVLPPKSDGLSHD
jgi:hypothetical protein